MKTLAIIAVIVAFGVGLVVGAGDEAYEWQREATERGYGFYNPTNGQWQWREPQTNFYPRNFTPTQTNAFGVLGYTQ